MHGKIHRNALQATYRLHWYEILSVLGQGGFGITYLARDVNLDEEVAIKEYLPIELAVREGDLSVHPVTDGHATSFQWGLDRFIMEARTLSKFRHPNIVRVRNVFEENNTAYIVMDYERGESLQERLSDRKTLEEAEIMQILIPILGGLHLVHEGGFIHRDIKPANIFIRSDHSPVLLDFGSARQSLGQQTKTLTSLVSPGYAPFEQYYSKSDEQGPWTDIYGLGATLYRAISGITPIDAIDRSRAIVEGSKDNFVPAIEIGAGRYSKRFLSAIDHALQFKPQARPQSIPEWLDEFGIEKDLAGISDTETTAAARPKRPTPTGPRRKGTRRGVLVGSVAALLIAGAIVAVNQPAVRSTLDALWSDFRNVIPGADNDRSVDHRSDEERRATREAELQRLKEQLQARQRQEEVALLLTQGEAFIAAGRYLEPPGENALARYASVLELDPQNPGAAAGKRRLLGHFLDDADSLIDGRRFDDADGALLRAAVIEPNSVEIRLARVRLKDAVDEAKRVAAEEANVRAQAERQRLAALEKQRAEEERRRQEAERQRMIEEQQRVEAEKRQQEEARLAALERQRRGAEAQRQAEELKRSEFEAMLATAAAAVDKRDKEAAISRYRQALTLYPNDADAAAGLRAAEQLLDKVCYEVLGRWQWKRVFGKDTMVLKQGGAIDYHSTVSGSGRWECADPQNRAFTITLTAAGFSNTWTAKLSADGACLDAAHGGCFVRPK